MIVPVLCDHDPKRTGGYERHSASHNTTVSKFVLRWMRFVLLELPVVLSFTGVLILYGIGILHDKYYVPLMDRSTRTDADLQQEITYYHRTCTAADITTQDAADVLANPRAPVSQSVDQIMTYGALVIPQILKPETVRNLRDYAVYRNRVIPEHEQYPVSQGHNRISFGYDATEHPALVQAVREVTQHKFLKKLLTALLGDVDPASTEITTITQSYGAPEMCWHPDTKPDGNAVKFSRTYGHSFSLFVSLQNTTKEMGATNFCFGSHFCAVDDLEELCEGHAVGLHAATPEQVFRAGDGAMFNQHTWHAAPPHVDPHAPDRIMFIMSFLARPKPNLDQRQLSRGTYFHQKWNMWGHTWSDLVDPLRYMSKPFSYLKCLSLWSASSNWGYDLVTATYMRFSNGQLGADLSRLIHIWDNILEWPTWLHGRNLEYEVEEKEAWQTFIQETIEILTHYAEVLALALHAFYILFLFGMWLSTRSTQDENHSSRASIFVRSTAFRICCTHGIVATLFFLSIEWVDRSDWAQGVTSGQVLKRPFPPFAEPTEEEEQIEKRRGSLTTLPMGNDVLFGERYDAPWLGAYEHWLDWHRGNRIFLEAEQEQGPWFVRQKDFPALQTHIVEELQRDVARNGARFLKQDVRTGDWRILTGMDRVERLQNELVYSGRPLLHSIQEVSKRMIAFYRFTSSLRGSAMAKKSVVFLSLLQNRLVSPFISRRVQDNPPTNSDLSSMSFVKAPKPMCAFASQTRRILPSQVKAVAVGTLKSRRFVPPCLQEEEPFPVGSSVLFKQLTGSVDGNGSRQTFWVIMKSQQRRNITQYHWRRAKRFLLHFQND